VLDIIATTALVVSVLILAWQAREQAKETALANDLAREEALRHAMRSIDGVLTMIVEHPELHPYFREGANAPENDPVIRGQVEDVAELMVEALQTAIRANDKVPDGPDKEDLEGYAREVFASSPTIDALLGAHPDWWPRLAAIHRGESRLATRTRREVVMKRVMKISSVIRAKLPLRRTRKKEKGERGSTPAAPPAAP
jgi:hypothetical protein